MLETDVCIIGSGPAGTISSLLLSKHKIPHILVEREQFPRDKVCGECYDGRLIRTLTRIDPDLIDNMKKAQIIQDVRHFSYINSRLHNLDIDIDPKGLARISTNRSDFDKYLLDEALKSPYTQYFDNKNITEYRYTEGCYPPEYSGSGGVIVSDTIETINIKSKMVFVATGSNSPFTQKIAPQNQSNGHFLLVSRGYYRNLVKVNGKDSFQIYLFRKPFAHYLVIVNLPNNLSTVEVGILKSVSKQHHANPTDLLINIVNNHPELKNLFANAQLEGKIKGAVLPKTTPPKPISAERVFLMGSAATSINPVTGWGVGHAAFQASCAVDHYLLAAEKNDFSADYLKEYDQQVYKSIRKEQFVGKMADLFLLYGYGVLDWALSIVARNTWLMRKVGNLINSL